jgi:hypothetical protein
MSSQDERRELGPFSSRNEIPWSGNPRPWQTRHRVAGGGNLDGPAVPLALVVEVVVVSRPQLSARTNLVPFSVTSEEALDRGILTRKERSERKRSDKTNEALQCVATPDEQRATHRKLTNEETGNGRRGTRLW